MLDAGCGAGIDLCALSPLLLTSARIVGLSDICAEPKTLTLTDLSLAENVFDLPALLGRMKQAGIFSDGDIAAINNDLSCRARAGTFTSGYSGYLVRGRTPEEHRFLSAQSRYKPAPGLKRSSTGIRQIKKS